MNAPDKQIEAEAARLAAEWQRIDADPSEWFGPLGEDREQEAYDALVDYCEAHGLPLNTYDPRPDVEDEFDDDA